VQEKLRINDNHFFKSFTESRKRIEQFLIDNKSLIGILSQNLSRSQRVPKMKELFDLLVKEFRTAADLKPEDAITKLGIRGRILDATAIPISSQISDDTKSMVYVREAIARALRCPVCGGILDPTKSVSYDHIVPRRVGGTGDASNTQMAHPYCNTAKESLACAK